MVSHMHRDIYIYMFDIKCLRHRIAYVYIHSGGGSRETGEKLAAIGTYLQLETVRI